MNKFAWSLPLALLAAPAFAGTGSDQGIGFRMHQDTASMPIDIPRMEQDNIILAQDSTSQYDVKFEYSNSAYGQAEVANYGEAFKDGALVAKAEVTDVQEIAANQARVRVEVTHFDQSGQVVYEGVIYYRKGLPGTIISENTVFGAKDHHIFTTWPTW